MLENRQCDEMIEGRNMEVKLGWEAHAGTVEGGEGVKKKLNPRDVIIDGDPRYSLSQCKFIPL